MLELMQFIFCQLFVHFRISSSLSFQRKTKRHVFLLLFVLTPVHLNWPSYATGKCYRSPLQLISTMKHWWLYITINSLAIFKWKMRNVRLNLIYLSFFQYSLFQRDKKPRHIRSMSLDVSTKNSVDEPSKVTIQFEGRPPCRVSLQVQF